jgi:methionyl-tRNA formyltransferase
MKILLVSKNNEWSEFLYNSLKQKINIHWVNSLTKEIVEKYNPNWIFFFHWSEIVSKDIFENYKCAVIHTGNLPKGKGGSPLQNQILDEITSSYVNIIEMKEEIDSGGIYCSSPITLQGNITDIWITIAIITKDLILKCINEDLIPRPQFGESQIYKRKKDNQIKFDDSLYSIYNQIRILDSKEYPNAYIDIGEFRLEFSRAKLENNEIISDVKIRKK